MFFEKNTGSSLALIVDSFCKPCFFFLNRLKHTHSLTHTLAHSHTHTLTHTRARARGHTHTHTHIHTGALFPAQAHAHTQSRVRICTSRSVVVQQTALARLLANFGRKIRVARKKTRPDIRWFRGIFFFATATARRYLVEMVSKLINKKIIITILSSSRLWHNC